MNQKFFFTLLCCIHLETVQVTCSSATPQQIFNSESKTHIIRQPKQSIKYDNFGHTYLHNATHPKISETSFLSALSDHPELINLTTQKNKYKNIAFHDTIATLCTYYKQWNKLTICIARGGDPYIENINKKNAFNNNCNSQQDILNAQNAIAEGAYLYNLRNIHTMNEKKYKNFQRQNINHKHYSHQNQTSHNTKPSLDSMRFTVTAESAPNTADRFAALSSKRYQ